METIVYVVILLLIIAGMLLLWLSANQRRSTGLPAGRVVYSDTSSWGKVEEPIYDSFYDLTGKPDYIIEKDNTWIPVEVKSMSAPLQPYRGHIYQLAAYCLLIERTKGKRPPYGILHYRERTFAIEYTLELRNNLVNLLAQIRDAEKERKGPPRSHEQYARCARCGYRLSCDDAIQLRN